jgi:hypothetical protein
MAMASAKAQGFSCDLRKISISPRKIKSVAKVNSNNEWKHFRAFIVVDLHLQEEKSFLCFEVDYSHKFRFFASQAELVVSNHVVEVELWEVATQARIDVIIIFNNSIWFNFSADFFISEKKTGVIKRWEKEVPFQRNKAAICHFSQI